MDQSFKHEQYETFVFDLEKLASLSFESTEYDSNDPAKRFEGNANDGRALAMGTYYYKITLPGGKKHTGYLHIKQ